MSTGTSPGRRAGGERRRCRCRLGTDGNAAAEFALVVPVLLILVLGAFEFGRLYWIGNNLQFAAEEAARWVMVHPSPTPSTATVQGQFNAQLAAVDPADVVFTTSLQPIPGAVTGTQGLRIDATYTFTFLPALPSLLNRASGSGGGLPTITLRGQSTAPLN